jgi:hypothetical protein
MADGFVHTVYKNDQWVNELEGWRRVRWFACNERSSCLRWPQARPSRQDRTCNP